MSTDLAPGFANPVLHAQSAFRAIMEATARPGTIFDLPETAAAPPKPLSRGAGVIALTLFDHDTPVWLDPACAATPDVAYWLRFHTHAPLVSDPAAAAFAILADPEAGPPFASFAPGTQDYPDRSATLILQVASLEDGAPMLFTGPGINSQTTLGARPLPADFRQRLIANRALFPRGLDLLLVTDDEVAALPRSVRLIDED